ncbi:hypothetical protein [Alcanivorax sp. 1008]|uniref:hypothetical protein n=1 Tax=Alcanivorax sp. 1008 TaxID=2816853 RepID=UPI001DB0C513|nr:hypothetical protein [Alcanivorax sp. 1008]MCC1497887.1 hypothetical protein [Alcanivorax sp. 1008]
MKRNDLAGVRGTVDVNTAVAQAGNDNDSGLAIIQGRGPEIKKGPQLRCDPYCADSIVIVFRFLVLPSVCQLADHAVLARRTVVFIISAGFLLFDPGATSPFFIVSRLGSYVAALRLSLQ